MEIFIFMLMLFMWKENNYSKIKKKLQQQIYQRKIKYSITQYKLFTTPFISLNKMVSLASSLEGLAWLDLTPLLSNWKPWWMWPKVVAKFCEHYGWIWEMEATTWIYKKNSGYLWYGHGNKILLFDHINFNQYF
jgi:hypothetical protein